MCLAEALAAPCWRGGNRAKRAGKKWLANRPTNRKWNVALGSFLGPKFVHALAPTASTTLRLVTLISKQGKSKKREEKCPHARLEMELSGQILRR